MADITNFNIGQGESFRILVEVINETQVDIDTTLAVPQDLNQVEFIGALRETYSTEETAATFNIQKIEPFTSGAIIVSLTPEQTTALENRKYVYNLDMVSGSLVVRRLLEGSFMIRPSATR
jgi:hypothetical protein